MRLKFLRRIQPGDELVVTLVTRILAAERDSTLECEFEISHADARCSAGVLRFAWTEAES
jgi:hypothetical protein